MSESAVSQGPRRVLAGYVAGQFGRARGRNSYSLTGYSAGLFGRMAANTRSWRAKYGANWPSREEVVAARGGAAQAMQGRDADA